MNEADTSLWPAVPEQIPAMESLAAEGGRARRIAFRRTAPRSTSARAQARPYGEEARKRDRESFVPEMARLAVLGPEIESLQEDRRRARGRADAPTPEERKNADERIAMLEGEQQGAREQGLAACPGSSTPTRTSSSTTSSRSSSGTSTCSSARPRDDRPTRKDVAARLEFARTVRKRTIDDYAANWRDTIVADRPLASLRRLRIKEQLGLVPLGPDPMTGLFEFTEVQTGEPPVREPGKPVTMPARESGWSSS